MVISNPCSEKAKAKGQTMINENFRTIHAVSQPDVLKKLLMQAIRGI
jgi:hypothetical protein